MGFGHDEREQTLNQILVSLDGFERTDTVVVIAATNRSDILDPALLRPGRFDRRIKVPALSLEARERAWEIHTRDKTLAEDVSLTTLAEMTAGYTGAELECAANGAVLLAIRRARQSAEKTVVVSQTDFVRALEPIRSGRPEYDQLETLLIDSVSHVTRPAGDAIARISVRGASDVVGQVVWADAAFIKLKDLAADDETIIAKQLIESIRVLPGTEVANLGEISAAARAVELPGAV
jgi:cell division protease FtsH